MTNEERERTVATDVRSRVIADCAALLPLARSACAAMDDGDEAEVLRLFCGESQKQTLRRLGRLIDDLRLCRTAADLPGPEPEVIELRNASFRVFRGLSIRAGDSRGTVPSELIAVQLARQETPRQAISGCSRN